MFLGVLERMVKMRIENELFEREKPGGGGVNFVCKLCGRRFNTKRGIEMHIRQKHQEEVTRIVLKKLFSQ